MKEVTMTNPYNQLKSAAELLEKTAEALEAAAAKADSDAVELAQAKKEAAEAAKQAKVASEVKPAELDKAKLAPLAKQAAARLLGAGLLSTQEQADIFASEILDPEKAIAKLAQLGAVAVPHKRAEVVEDTAQTPLSADEVYEAACNKYLQSNHG